MLYCTCGNILYFGSINRDYDLNLFGNSSDLSGQLLGELVESSNTRECPTFLSTLTHDWTQIAKYIHNPLLGREWQQLPAQHSFATLGEAPNIKGFCQQVCRLLSGINWEDLNEAFLDPLPEVMILLINVCWI
jgi:hypothetical protein